MKSLWLLAIFTYQIVPSTAFAQDVARARDFYRAGTTAYQEQRWEACAHNFEDSFEIVHAPELLYNIGVCYQRAGEVHADRALPNWNKAIFAYRRYLRENDVSEQERIDITRVISILVSSVRAIEESGGPNGYYDPIYGPDDDGPANPELLDVQNTSVMEEYTSGPSDPEPDIAHSNPVVYENTTGVRPRYRFTLISAAMSFVSSLSALVVGLMARNQYDQCIDSGCVDGRNHIQRMARTANILWSVSAIFAISSATSFVLEYKFRF